MRRWGIERGYASVDEVLREGLRFDVVSICSPTSEHHAQLLACPSLGPVVVFCEKPVCATVAEAEHAVAYLRKCGIALAVNHNRRWDPEVIALRDELARGAWGRLRCVTAHYNKGVLNNGSHMLDLLGTLLGPLHLSYAGPPSHDHWEYDPSVPALLLAPGGVPVVLNCGHAADYSLFEAQLVLEKATIAMEDGGLRWRIRDARNSPEFAGYKSLTVGEVRPGRYMESMSRAVQNVHDAVSSGLPLASTGETALAAQRLCEQIKRESARCFDPS